MKTLIITYKDNLEFAEETAAVLKNDWNIESGINNRFPSYSGLIADFDNDGWQDIYVSNLGQPNKLYLNQQGGTFREISAQAASPASNMAARTSASVRQTRRRFWIMGA